MFPKFLTIIIYLLNFRAKDAVRIFMEKKQSKVIGLIGGMSWKSTIPYYKIINETINKELGGFHSAKIIIYSVDFAEIEKYQADGNWTAAGNELGWAAHLLQEDGADFIVLCTNTMHKVVPSMQAGYLNIPVLHIAEVTANEICYRRIKKVGLLGTKYTMTQNFYKEKLAESGIECIIPDDENIEIINDVIYNELCKGIISPAAKQKFLHIIEKLHAAGAEGIVLGCTEIGLLIKQKDIQLPVFDTTTLHAERAAMFALGM